MGKKIIAAELKAGELVHRKMEKELERAVSDATMAEMLEYLKNKEPVSIHYNNELGDWMWAISVNADPGFWLDAFTTKKAAVAFCKKNKLPVTGYIRDDK
jgi:hypothetical protein